MQMCRDCALPWMGAPCGNCGCGEPAVVRPPAPAPIAERGECGPAASADPVEPKPKAITRRAATPRVSTTVRRTSTTVDGPGGGTTVKVT